MARRLLSARCPVRTTNPESSDEYLGNVLFFLGESCSLLPFYPIRSNEFVEIPLNLLVDINAAVTQESEKSLSSSSPLWSATGCHVRMSFLFVFFFGDNEGSSR